MRERLCHNCRYFDPSMHNEKYGHCQAYGPNGVKVKGHFMGLTTTQVMIVVRDNVCEMHKFKYRR